MGDERGIVVLVFAGKNGKESRTGAGFCINFYLTRPLLLGSFYLTRPLLLGEAPPSLLNPPLLRSGGLKAWPAGPVRANKLSP